MTALTTRERMEEIISEIKRRGISYKEGAQLFSIPVNRIYEYNRRKNRRERKEWELIPHRQKGRSGVHCPGSLRNHGGNHDLYRGTHPGKCLVTSYPSGRQSPCSLRHGKKSDGRRGHHRKTPASPRTLTDHTFRSPGRSCKKGQPQDLSHPL